MDIREIVNLAISLESEVSDIHISSGIGVFVRIGGRLRKLIEIPPIEAELMLENLGIFFASHLIKPSYKSLKLLEQGQHIDVGLTIEDAADSNSTDTCQADFDLKEKIIKRAQRRLRLNISKYVGGISMAIRVIPQEVPTLSQLNFLNREIIENLCCTENGLILITGPTGSGKTSTLAAIINHINNTYYGHIITIEDPIEYLHECNKCLIHQKEVGLHATSFENALVSVLREDVNYIIIGEMRNTETVKLALTAAETGHLVFGTLHTNSACETINRIVDVFPSSEKDMARSLLASSLRAVLSQAMKISKQGKRVATQEIMICNQAIKNLIREDKVYQIRSIMQTGKSSGMRTFEQHIAELSAAGIF